MDFQQLLLLFALIILSCIIINRITQKLGLPILIIFIGVGMLFGSDGLIKIAFSDYQLTFQIATTALIFIMFYGGFGTNWKQAKPVAFESILLSFFGVIITMLFTGLFAYYVLHFSFLESFLIGAVVSSTDAASVFSILRWNRLNLKYNTASLLEVESGSNDPMSYLLTIIVLSAMLGQIETNNIIIILIKQIVIGCSFGYILALLIQKFMSRFKFPAEGFDAVFLLAVVIISYIIPDMLGGNGFLSAYIFGIILGNKKLPNKKGLVNFFDGITSLMQMILFFLLGLLSLPSHIPNVLTKGFAIFMFMLFVARPLTVYILVWLRLKNHRQLFMISWAGLRGAASIVFAIMALVSDVNLNNDIYHIVFIIVLLSITIQGSLLPWLSKKLEMVDESSNVLKTFNDYADEEDVNIQFIEVVIEQDHPWEGKMLKNIDLIPGMRIAMILRGNNNFSIAPTGNTVIHLADTVIISGTQYVDDGIKLIEFEIEEGNSWIGKKIKEIDLSTIHSIVFIKRKNQVLIPDGDTVIHLNDSVVVNEGKWDVHI